MKKQIITILGLIFFMTVAFPVKNTTAKQKPNVLLIMSDDQGWGDFSRNYNQIIETPTINALASDGLVFNRFYVSAMCAPTRASLLTETLKAKIEKAHDPEYIPSPDRIKRKEVYEKIWTELEFGSTELKAGNYELLLLAENIANNEIGEVKSVFVTKKKE